MSQPPWLEKFTTWKSIVRKGCKSAIGPASIYCLWLGRNCSYNDCPRRNFEETRLRPLDEDRLELLAREVEQLRHEISTRDEQINSLIKQLEEKKIEEVPAAG